MRNLFASFLIVAMLGACASDKPKNESGVGAVPTATIGTELAGPDTYLGQMPTAFVLLTGTANDVNRSQKVAFCKAFIQVPTATKAQAGSAVALNLVRTRWLIDQAGITDAQSTDCDGFLVDHYDFTRAKNLIGQIKLSKGSFASGGPFFVVVSGGNIAALDASTFADYPTFTKGWGDFVNNLGANVATNVKSGDSKASLWEKIAGIVLQLIGKVWPGVQAIEGVIQDVVCDQKS